MHTNPLDRNCFPLFFVYLRMVPFYFLIIEIMKMCNFIENMDMILGGKFFICELQSFNEIYQMMFPWNASSWFHSIFL